MRQPRVPSREAEVSETESIAKLDPPACAVRILGQCLLSNGREEEAELSKAKAAQPEGAAGKTDTANAEADGSKETLSADEQPPAAEPEGAAGKAHTANAEADGSKETLPTDEQPPAAEPEGAAGKAHTANAEADGSKETLPTDERPPAAEPEGAAGKAHTANAEADGNKETLPADVQPQKKAADQTDDLLFPTEAELRAIKAAEKAAQTKGAAGEGAADSDTEVAEPQTGAPPLNSIESDMDPESWAEYGGWYRQDYAIFYRPTGHKDKFIYSWLLLTGPQAPKGDTSPAAAVFDFLTSKDAQGSCTKCHSVDDIEGKGQIVNFSPLSVESKQGRFTNFIHEPHFQAVGIGQRIGILENRGCLTCHNLEKGPPYLKSYEQGNPQNFVSNFGEVKKDLCQTCHNNSTARQDCLLCHKYHVNGVITPIMSTKIPTQ